MLYYVESGYTMLGIASPLNDPAQEGGEESFIVRNVLLFIRCVSQPILGLRRGMFLGLIAQPCFMRAVCVVNLDAVYCKHLLSRSASGVCYGSSHKIDGEGWARSSSSVSRMSCRPNIHFHINIFLSLSPCDATNPIALIALQIAFSAMSLYVCPQ